MRGTPIKEMKELLRLHPRIVGFVVAVFALFLVVLVYVVINTAIQASVEREAQQVIAAKQKEQRFGFSLMTTDGLVRYLSEIRREEGLNGFTQNEVLSGVAITKCGEYQQSKEFSVFSNASIIAKDAIKEAGNYSSMTTEIYGDLSGLHDENDNDLSSLSVARRLSEISKTEEDKQLPNGDNVQIGIAVCSKDDIQFKQTGKEVWGNWVVIILAYAPNKKDPIVPQKNTNQSESGGYKPSKGQECSRYWDDYFERPAKALGRPPSGTYLIDHIGVDYEEEKARYNSRADEYNAKIEQYYQSFERAAARLQCGFPFTRDAINLNYKAYPR